MSARKPGAGLHATALLMLACIPLAGAQTRDDAAGFIEVDPATLAGPAYYDAARFPDIGASVFHPDAELPAPVRAVLLVDAGEPEVHHARYRVRYDLIPATTEEAEPLAHVEVVRFNLGPAIRAGLATMDPALPLAPPEAFGTGPHVAFRFTMGPVQGMQAAIRRVQRRELGDAEASAMDCLGRSCLDPDAYAGPDGDWQPLDPAMPPLPFGTGGADGAGPAAVLAFLHEAIGEDARRPIPRMEPATARFEFILDKDLEGQAGARQGLARNAVVLDDQIGTHWIRWRAAGGEPYDAAILAVPR